MGAAIDSNIGGSKEEKNIEEITIKILKAMGSIDIPIDPVKIANMLNINVYCNRFKLYKKDVVSGAIVKNGEQVNIYVNETDSIEIQRFTIAHELGHFYMHLKGDKGDEYIDLHLATGLSCNKKQEEEANEFAAALLMPKEFLVEYYEKISPLGVSRNCIIQWLSEIFKVSKEAMHYRLKNLKLM